MKAQNLKTVDEKGQLCGHTSKGVRERVTMMVIAPGVDEWRLIGHLQTKGEITTLAIGDLRRVILEAEEIRATHRDLPFAAPFLQPKGIKGYKRRDVRRQGGWAFGVACEPVTFANADQLFHHLRAGGYMMLGNQALKEGQDTRQWLFRSNETPASMTAWEIAHYRLEHDGQLPPHLEVPAGTCPQCLSRHVAMPWDGETFYCQECGYDG